ALPDLARDITVGVRGLPHRLGVTTSSVTSSVFVLLTSALLAFGPSGTPSPVEIGTVPIAGIVLGIGLVRNRQSNSRSAFRAVILVALLSVSLLIHNGPVLG